MDYTCDTQDLSDLTRDMRIAELVKDANIDRNIIILYHYTSVYIKSLIIIKYACLQLYYIYYYIYYI